MWREVGLVTVSEMEDDLRLPLLRGVVARLSTREWVALDVAVATVAAAGLLTAIALGGTFRLSGAGWGALRYGCLLYTSRCV